MIGVLTSNLMRFGIDIPCVINSPEFITAKYHHYYPKSTHDY